MSAESNIFVWCELENGVVSGDCEALIGKARELCGFGAVTAVIVGFPTSAAVGADYELCCELDCRNYRKAEILKQMVERYRPDIVLFPATIAGSQVAAHTAARLDTGLCADCTELWMDGKLLVMHRPAFGGGVEADIICPKHRPQMATVRPGSVKLGLVPNTLPKRIDFVPTDLPDDMVELISSFVSPPAENIRDAKIIVSGGLGVGSREGFGLLGELAKKLGGQLGASRGAVDAGYADWSRQVGQTGSVVCPQLYLAFGISGAVQHIAGMHGAKCVIAVNSDPKAPIFDYSDYAIVGDWRALAERILRELS